jgi:hypothetical protein
VFILWASKTLVDSSSRGFFQFRSEMGAMRRRFRGPKR